MKKYKVNDLKKKLWTLVSRYVRLTYARDGYNICYTCGVVKPVKEMQAGHAFSGRKNSFLFELDIIRPQCYGCNVCNSGKLDEFCERLREEVGDMRFAQLYKLKKQVRKFTTAELLLMIKLYKQMVNDLSKEKGIYW